MKRPPKRGAAASSLQSLSKDLLSLQMVDAASQSQWKEVRSLLDAGIQEDNNSCGREIARECVCLCIVSESESGRVILLFRD